MFAYDLLITHAELTKKKDAGRYGVGYFQPDNCDNVDIMCEYVPYPEFEHLQIHYNSTKDSTLSIKDYEASTKILTCPSSMSVDLPPTPQVELLECSVLQPVCNGAISNNFNHDGTQALAMGTVKTPSNVGTEEDSVAGNAPSAPTASGSESSGSVEFDTSASNKVESWPTYAAVVFLATFTTLWM